MKSKFLITALILLGIASTGCIHTEPSAESQTSQETLALDSEQGQEVSTPAPQDSRLEDLNFLCETLEKKHKNMYFKISKEDFTAEKEKSAAILPSLNDIDFYYEMKRLVALIGDAHTNVNFIDSQHDHLRPLPFAVTKIDGAWYIEAVDKTWAPYLGYQVTAIQDVPIEEVYSRAAHIITYENEAMLEKKFPSAISFIDALKYLKVTDTLDAVQVTLKEPRSGKQTTVEFPSYNGKEFFSLVNIVTMEAVSSPTKKSSEIYRSMKLDDSTYFIQYNSCKEDERLPMADFTEQVLSDLTGAGYTKVIVDLRYNTGGNSAVLSPLIQMLQECQSTSAFQVYTLIGRDTNSSAILNAMELKEAVNCLFVGTPTGGNVNHYGELESFELPNFPGRVYYSTKYFELVPGYEKDSIYPDIPVTTTYDEAISGVDKEVLTVLENNGL